ncbi:MAG: methyltransferase domain-containing protein [Sphingorhabdus sp.]
MAQIETQEDVQDYFVRHASRFNGLYGGDNMATRFFDRMFRKPMYDRYRFTIEALANGEGKKYLDIGCGSGRYAVNLAQLGADVTGLDFSDKMLKLAGDYAAQQNVADKVTLINTDMNKWMEKSVAHFDASYAMGVFDYLTDPVLTLKLMIKLADKTYVSIPAPEFPRAQLRKWRYAGQDCPVYFFSEKQMESLVADAGGKVVDMKKLGGSGFWVEIQKA